MGKESVYQRKIINRLENDGWFVMRLLDVTTTVSKNGTPDLVAMKPSINGLFDVQFIEVKAKGGKASPLQKFTMKKLKEDFGFNVSIDEEK
jgi:Holliday junction resolvase